MTKGTQSKSFVGQAGAFFLAFLLSPSLFAQNGAASYSDLPFLQQPQLGLYLWWAFEDQTTNANVTSWTDRIQGALLTSSTPPLNTSTGVFFSGSAELDGTKTASSAQAGLVLTYWIVIDVNYWQNTWAIFNDVPAGVQQFLSPTTGGAHWSSSVIGVESGVIYTNSIMDMLIGNNGPGGAGGSPVLYTNGVVDAAAPSGGLDMQFTKILAQAGYTYEILEMRWYTNTSASQQMATLHTAYRRRNYGGQ